jgi:hypothetical protein
MVDWKGLLNWSLQYNDGTRPSEDIKPMSKEDMEFLQKAFESVCIDEMKEIWKILDICKKREGDSEKEIDERVELLNELSNFLDGLENSRNIVRAKRLNEIIDYFFDCKHKKVKITLGNIITQMTQNDGFVQKACKDLGIFRFLDELNKSDDQELNKMYIYMMTGMIYGDELEVRKYFIEDLKGITFLNNMLIREEGNFKNERRLLNICADLTKIIDHEDKKDSGVIRMKALEKIKEIDLHHKFLLLLNDFDYSSKDKCDIIHVIFDNIVNVLELYENVEEEVFKKIKEKNELIGKTEGLSEKKVADEKKFLIKIISRVKSRQKEIQEKGKKVEENVKHESKMINGKESMRIELKK